MGLMPALYFAVFSGIFLHEELAMLPMFTNTLGGILGSLRSYIEDTYIQSVAILREAMLLPVYTLLRTKKLKNNALQRR